MTYYLAVWIVLILIGLAHSTRFGMLLYTMAWRVCLTLQNLMDAATRRNLTSTTGPATHITTPGTTTSNWAADEES